MLNRQENPITKKKLFVFVNEYTSVAIKKVNQNINWSNIIQ